MDPIIYLLTICLPLATVALVFGMKYYASLQQAKATAARDAAYEQLARQSAASQADAAAALATLNVTLADLKTRVAAIEQILKAVE